MQILVVAVCALGVAGVLGADAWQRPRLEWVAKPLAALAFILSGLLWGALDSTYGQWILAGLVLGALGDVLLIPKTQGRSFLLGMVAFLLGHVAYVVAFMTLPQNLVVLGIATLGVAVFMAVIFRWLMPHVPADFKLPVTAYNIVIGAMMIVACGAVGGGAHPLIAIGALGFAASDISVARNRFVTPGLVNRLWGIPLYFTSQILIAATIALVAAA